MEKKLYEAPTCEVLEMSSEGMICSSIDPGKRGYVDYGEEYDF